MQGVVRIEYHHDDENYLVFSTKKVLKKTELNNLKNKFKNLFSYNLNETVR